jgi:hypothetical protein
MGEPYCLAQLSKAQIEASQLSQRRYRDSCSVLWQLPSDGQVKKLPPCRHFRCSLPADAPYLYR